MAMHKMQQRQLPLVLIGAGLPILPALAGESKSYAERLFQFPDIGPLSESDATKALQYPVKATGVKFTADALREDFPPDTGISLFSSGVGISITESRQPVTDHLASCAGSN